jgi:Kef-type K+ transport system membrane component KefB
LDNPLYVAMVLSILIMLASMISVEVGVTVAMLGWDLRAALIGGIALSTTSLAVVYAVLVETGLNKAEIGELIMPATFVTVVVLTAVLPTVVAQRWFTPLKPTKDQPSREGQIG